MAEDDFTGDANGSEVAALQEAPEATAPSVPAPVETSATATDTEPTTPEAETLARDEQGRFASEAETTETPAEAEAPAEKVTPTQQRINKAVRAQRDAERRAADKEREAEYWRQQAERSKGSGADPALEGAPSHPAGEPEPAFEQFQSEADPWLAYNKALSRWAAREAVREEQSKQATLAQQQQQQSRLTKHQHDMQALRAVTPDYDSLMEVAYSLPGTPALSEAILSSDYSARLMLYLAQHPDTFDEIYPLTGAPLYRALGRLESRLEVAPRGSASPTVLSRAKDPIKPLGTSPIVADSPPTDADSDDAHFTYWNRKDEEARRRR